MGKNYYQILGVDREATEEEIKKAYKQKALIFHPDKNKSPDAQEQFKVIGKAYAILLDKNERRKYDLTQRPRTNETNSSNSSKSSCSSSSKAPYKKFKSGCGSGPTSPTNWFRRVKDPPTIHPLFVTPEELAKGCTKKMKITRKITYKTGLTARVANVMPISINSGMKVGTKITLAQAGDINFLSYRVPADIIFIVTLKHKSSSSKNDNRSESEKESEKTEQKHEPSPTREPFQPEPEFVKTFEELNLRPELLEGIYAMGFTSPNFVQDKCLPTLLNLDSINILARTESKTGKIAAFCIAALNKVNERVKETQVVILAPNQERVLRIDSILREIGKFCKNTTVAMVNPEGTVSNVKSSAQILIGTTADIMRLHFDRGFRLPKIRLLVLDDLQKILCSDSLSSYLQCRQLIMLVPEDVKKLAFCSTSFQHVFVPPNWFPDAEVLELK